MPFGASYRNQLDTNDGGAAFDNFSIGQLALASSPCFDLPYLQLTGGSMGTPSPYLDYDTDSPFCQASLFFIGSKLLRLHTSHIPPRFHRFLHWVYIGIPKSIVHLYRWII